MRQIPATTGDLPLLLRLAREDRDFSAECALVVVEAFESKTQRMILVAAIIAQQCRLEDLEFERMRRIFAVNSIGPIRRFRSRNRSARSCN